MTDTPILRAEGVEKRFGHKRALAGLTLEVPRGSVVALAGANGAGKTTALRTLLNVYRPDAGRAELLGCDSRKLGPAQFARIGYVAEDQQLPGSLTVDQWMAFCRPFYPDWSDTQAAELLLHFGLPRGRRLRQLSRGMRVKAALASALAAAPELLMLDEPFSGLDPLVCDQLIESILARTPELTVLLCSHDLAEIESIADSIVWLQEGTVAFQEDLQTLLDRFRQVEVLLEGEPQREALRENGWLQVESSGRNLRFVCPDYQESSLAREVQARFGVSSLSVRPMRLREIAVCFLKQEKPSAKGTFQ